MSWIEDPGWEVFRGSSLSNLRVDQAYVNIYSQLSSQIWLYSLSEECYKCPYSRAESIPPGENHLLTMSTKHPVSWRLLADGSMDIMPRQNRSSLICEVEPELGEFGVYELNISGSTVSDISCRMHTVQDPVNIYLPLVLCLVILALIWIVCWVACTAIQRWLKHRNPIILPTSDQQTGSVPEDKTPPQQTNQRQRLKSLDTFRGISIILMIFVNDGAGGYSFLEHATWNGLQLADVLFPWFMWIMGVCIPISVKSQLKKNVPRFTIFVNVVRRACILFLLGLILNSTWGSRLETLRLFGVLQRFGLVYFVIATLAICFTCRSYSSPKGSFVASIQDVLVLLPQWVIMVGVVAGHCVLTFYLEVPGCPTGYLGPGGIQDNGKFNDCIGGATGYVDRLVLGVQHIYQHPTANEIYNAGPFDPEGLVGCLLSVFQVFLGVQAGTTLIFYPEWKQRVVRWLAWGTVMGILGAILCLASKENGWIPVNKNLWSLSFVLVTSCLAFYLLVVCYFLIDIKNWWSGSPFFYPGMNATIMYVGHSVAYQMFPWHWSIGNMNTHFMQMIEALWGTGLWILIAFWLHHIKFFLSI